MVLVNDHLDHELGSEIRGAGYAKVADKAALDALTPATLAVGEIRTTTVDGLNWQWDGSEWLPWLQTPKLSYSLPAKLSAAVGRRGWPGFPTVTGTTHNAADAAGLDSALLASSPGDEIILADGVWDFGDPAITWASGQGGTADNPLIIRPATVDGVTVTSTGSLVMPADHVHFWNINLDGGTSTLTPIRIFGEHFKWLHSTISNVQTAGKVITFETGSWYPELADLTWTDNYALCVVMLMDNGGVGTRCKYAHFHHWDVDNTGITSGSIQSLVQSGEANNTGGLKGDHDDDTRMLFEYMDISWNSGAGLTFLASEIVQIKSSRNVFLYNVIESNNGTGHLGARDGSRNVIYGNHQARSSLACRFNGRENLAAYNIYTARTVGASIACQYNLANDVGDRGAFDNRLVRNIFSGDFTAVKTTDNGNVALADPNPLGNLISANWWDGAVNAWDVDPDGPTQAQVEADNSIDFDWDLNGSGVPNVDLPTTLDPLQGFSDLGHIDGGWMNIPPPWWWADAVALTSSGAVLYPPADAQKPAFELDKPLGQVRTAGTTADRPVLGLQDISFQYFDADLNAGAGMLIVWNGTNWVNPSTGATV